jgi:Dual specificity protein phosphatase, N-terminal half
MDNNTKQLLTWMNQDAVTRLFQPPLILACSLPHRHCLQVHEWLLCASLCATLAIGELFSSSGGSYSISELGANVCRRLYFTTFPHPPPSPQVLNRLSGEPGNQPRVRARPRGGPSASPDDSASYYYFTIDDQLLYLSFFQDWGPLNIAMVYKACILIHELLEVCQHTFASCHSRERVSLLLSLTG